MRLLAVVVLASMAVTSCTSIATVSVPEPDRLAADGSKFSDRATIYVFRGTSRAGAMCSFPVALDGAKLGSVRREQYLAFPARAGAHWLTISGSSFCEIPGFKINIEVKAGKSYYFMVEPDVEFSRNTITTSSNITQIDKRFADRLLSTYRAKELVGS